MGEDENGNGNGSALAALNPQHRAFVLAYTGQDSPTRWNAKRSCEEAGYSTRTPGTLEVQGSRLLRNDKVRAAIEEMAAAQGLTAEQIRAGWGEVASSPGPALLFDEAGRLDWAMVRKYSHLIESIRITDGSVHIRMYDKLRALSDAARALGMFRDIHELGGELEIRINVDF